jgi:ubiquinone biosynthesis protein Coq4
MYNFLVFIRSWLLVYLTHQLALPVLKLIRQPEIFPYTRDQLKRFPDGSLGKDLIEMLDQQRLELLTHYARHDMKHILLGYPTTDEGEVCLQAFMLGNRHLSFPVAITVVFGVLCMPEHLRSIIKAFKRGRTANSIAGWNWSEVVREDTERLKEKIFRPNTQDFT